MRDSCVGTAPVVVMIDDAGTKIGRLPSDASVNCGVVFRFRSR